MVLDQLQRAEAYAGLGSRFAKGFEFLRKTDLHALPPGRVAIEGELLFANVMDEPSRPREACRWESHRKFCDIQFIVAGAEIMGVTDVANLTVTDAYDDATDVAFYDGSPAAMTEVVVAAGMFTVFMPQDAHKPCIAIDGRPQRVRKIVVKVAV